jgi:protein O-GlcNAc transferase
MGLAIEQTLKLGIEHHKAGRLADAEGLYRQVLVQQPNHPEAMNLLGVVAQQVGRFDAAIQLYERSIRAGPKAGYFVNLGVALISTGRTSDAIAAYREALRLEPGMAVAHNNLAVALCQCSKGEEAIVESREAVRLNPNYPEAFNSLGNGLEETGSHDEAIAAYKKAIELRPDYAAAHCNLGSAYKAVGLLDAAISELQAAIAIEPGGWGYHHNFLNTIQLHPDYDAGRIFEECRNWANRFEPPLAKQIQPWTNERSRDRRLRIGYVSADLHSKHPIGRIIAPIMASHDARNFEIFCYSPGNRSDETTARIKSSVQAWRDVAAMSDAQLAQMIRQDRIDILVDLSLHTIGNRLLAFARRPAPVQATWLGYPGTTGLNGMQYRLTDPVLDPPGDGDEPYTEKLIRLPHCFWPYAPGVEDEVVNSLPAGAAGVITFGCFNSFSKISGPTVGLWIEVMQRVPKSRMLILCPRGEHRARLLEQFESAGVSRERVELIEPAPLRQYMRNYGRVDFCLDSMPYPGHTTTCDALWMGVPTITLRGKTAVARGGASILSNVGLSEWIADSPRQYVEIAVAMAGDIGRLARLRGELRDRLRNSALMNWRQFAADLESAYRMMWENWIADGS